MSRVCVLGLGNVLAGDDAAGPTVVLRLAAGYAFPPEVTVLEAGTPGFDLLSHVVDVDVLIVVDTVRADGPPGEVRTYSRDELLRHAAPARVGPHDPTLRETLLVAELHEVGPRQVTLIGVIPERVETGIGLTPAVRDALPTMEHAVLEELERLGRPARARAGAERVEPWWSRTEALDHA